jgi:D-glutamate cyclase
LNQEIENLAEIIDHLITTPVFSGSSLAARPVVLELYKAAREKFGKPLCLDATEKILSGADKSKTVLMTTGFVVPPWMEAETDGPIGTATLARSLNLGLDLVPVIVTEKSSVSKMKSMMEAVGFRSSDLKEAHEAPRKCAVVGFTTDNEKAENESEELIRETNPSSVIAIEKASPNRAGEFHSGVGVNISSVSAKVDKLIDVAKKSGIPTIGVGDAGNEIGMGCIEETVRELLPTGSKCGCPCNQGVASAVATDSLIVTGTSNWGGSAIEALLSFHLNAKELLHDSAMEIRMINTAAALGYIDPASGFADPGVDAIPGSIHGAIIDILNFIVSSRRTDSFYIRKYREYTKRKRD